MIRAFCFSLAVFSVFCASFGGSVGTYSFCEYDLSPEEFYALAASVEETAGGGSFALRISLASVILNRLKSPLYPDSVIRNIECSGFLSPGLGVSPSRKTEEAVRYAMFGASPAGRALICEKGEEMRGEGSVLIDGFVFYS